MRKFWHKKSFNENNIKEEQNTILREKKERYKKISESTYSEISTVIINYKRSILNISETEEEKEIRPKFSVSL